MTTHQYSDVIANSSDATFRAWGSALSAGLATAGLIQTSDTGQINWATVTRPAANTVGGYEIWRFNDSLQGTAPVYIKLEYGSNSTQTNPQMWLTIGTGTNGAGTLTGTTTTRSMFVVNAALGAGSYNTQICVKDGYVGVLFKNGSVSSNSRAAATFVVGRTCDSTGAETTEGAYVEYMDGSTAKYAWQSISFTAGAFTKNFIGCLVAGGVSSSVVGSDVQVFKHYQPFPRMRALLHTATVIATEITSGTTFSKALIGATARTYLSAGAYTAGVGPCDNSGTQNTAHALAILWE